MSEYQINENTICEESDEVVILNYNNEDEVIVLQEIEAYIWHTLKKSSLQETILLLKEEYEGDNIEEDTKEFVDFLIKRRILIKNDITSNH